MTTIILTVAVILLFIFAILSPICDALGIFGRPRKIIEWVFVVLGSIVAVVLIRYAIVL